jgi:dienelactone hydrolase/quercetin dioxygenase-like cupin family protein
MTRLLSAFKFAALGFFCACSPAGPRVSVDPAPIAPVSLIEAGGGERLFLGREREPTLIKVDSATVGARELFVFQRVLDPGATLGRHKHRDDEVIFVHSGEVMTDIGGVDRRAPIGSMIFAPGNAWMDVRNTGTAPATLLIIFGAPHMAEYIRSLGTKPAEPKRDLTSDFLGPIAANHGITFAQSRSAIGSESETLQAALLPHYRIYRPDGAGPFPTALFVSGCSGFEHPRAPLHYAQMAQRFTARGHAVVFADYVRARGLTEACNGVLSPADVGRYVLAAIDHLRGDPLVDRANLDIVGWSLGGGGVMAALSTITETQRAQVRSVVALYPDCSGLQPWSATVPTMLVFAGKDIVQPPLRCHRITAASSPTARVEMRSFPDAQHGFDMQGLPVIVVPGLPALAYDAGAANAAWVEIARFLGLPPISD